MQSWQRLAVGLTATVLAAACQAAGPTTVPGMTPEVSGFHTLADYGRGSTKKGVGVDPINMLFIGTRWEVAGVFASAGWVGADAITASNIAHQGKALFGDTYPTAPMSDLFYFGRRQDLAYQKNSTDIKKRDHLRLWMSNQLALDGRPVWFCAASRDIGIGVSKYSPTLITHKVEADRDLERDMVVQDLQNTGRMQNLTWIAGTAIDETTPFAVKTDGRQALVVLTPESRLFGE